MQKDYAEILLKSIDEVVSKRIEGVSYDITDTVTIIDDSESEKGKYLVSNGSATYYAYSTDTSYEEDNVVYMTVPNGDYTQQKIIIGKYVNENDKPYVFKSPFESIVDVTGNIITDTSIPTTGLIANNPEDANWTVLWSKNLSETNETLSGYTKLGVQGQFRTWLGDFNCASGDYGLVLRLLCLNDNISTEAENYKKAKEIIGQQQEYVEKDSEIGSYLLNTLKLSLEESFWEEKNIYSQIEKIEKKYDDFCYKFYDLYLSANDMYGNPYDYTSFFQQEKVFDISNLGTIVSCVLFMYEKPNSFFDKDQNLIPYRDEFFNLLLPNIFVKDCYICLGYDSQSFDENSLVLFTNSLSTYSSKNTDKENQKNVSLRWFYNDNVYNSGQDNSLDYEIRWYRYNLGSPSADEYSGVYWDRVNDKSNVRLPLSEINAIHSFPTVFYSNNEEKYTKFFNLATADTQRYSVKYFSSDFLQYYNIPNEVISKSFYQYDGFQNASKITVIKNDNQKWEDMFLNSWVFHDKSLEFSYYPRTQETANSNGKKDLLYGCIHYLGFWERFCLAYRLYWLAPEQFDFLGVSSIWREGGAVENDTWKQLKGKNPYKDITYNYGKIDFTGQVGSHFTISTTKNSEFKIILTSFTESFGQWKYTERNQFGIIDYRPADESIYLQLYNAALEIFQKLDNPYYTTTTNKPYDYIFTPNNNKAEEKVKAVLIKKDENLILTSNIITFTNEDEVVNDATKDFLMGLNIWCTDNTYGNYYIYDPGNKILPQYDTNEAHKLVAMFSAEDAILEQENKTSLLTEAESITWTFNTQNTMIIANDINYSYQFDENTIIAGASNGVMSEKIINGNIYYSVILSDNSEVFYDPRAKTISITRYGDKNNGYKINAEQLYFIKGNYAQSAQNNVVQCKIVKNGKEYFTSKRLYFGQAGTTGTDATLRLYFDPASKHALISKEGGDTLRVKAVLYDSQNKEIDFRDETGKKKLQIEWKWFAQNGTNLSISPYGSKTIGDQNNYNLQIGDIYYNSNLHNEIVLSTSDKIDMNTYLILEATVKGWGDYDLTVRRPIPIAAEYFNINEKKYKPTYIDGAEEVIYNTTGYPDYYKEPWQLHYADDADNNYSMDIMNGSWQIFGGDEFSGEFDENNILNPLSFFVKDASNYGAQYIYNNEILWTQPIHVCQNNYPSSTLNKWDGKTLTTDKDTGTILATAIAAGKKVGNTFSGVIIGDWSDNAASPDLTKQTGVYGFHEGEVSYAFIEDGTAFIGKSGQGRILFDGTHSTITSNWFEYGYGGMKLDFDDGLIHLKQPDTTNEIILDVSESNVPFKIGSNIDGYQFQVNWDGSITATNGNFSGTITGSQIFIPDADNPKFSVDKNGNIIATSGQIGGFYITDHSIFSTNSPVENPESVSMIDTDTYWGRGEHGSSYMDFRLGNTLFYDGSGNGGKGKMYLFSNLYNIKNIPDNIATMKDLESYFMFGINNSSPARLQIGSAASEKVGYDGISMYGNGGDIFFAPSGHKWEESVMVLSGMGAENYSGSGSITFRVAAENQHGIYARFA